MGPPLHKAGKLAGCGCGAAQLEAPIEGKKREVPFKLNQAIYFIEIKEKNARTYPGNQHPGRCIDPWRFIYAGTELN
jgi:hypothetical protein